MHDRHPIPWSRSQREDVRATVSLPVQEPQKRGLNMRIALIITLAFIVFMTGMLTTAHILNQFLDRSLITFTTARMILALTILGLGVLCTILSTVFAKRGMA